MQAGVGARSCRQQTWDSGAFSQPRYDLEVRVKHGHLSLLRDMILYGKADDTVLHQYIRTKTWIHDVQVRVNEKST
jgi:hypothetical protein